MRKLLLLVLLTLVALNTASAQDATPDAPVQRSKEELQALYGWTCPQEFAGQTLSFYNWAFYVADTTVPDFEVLCDVTVIQDVYESNESLIARLRQGNPGYDVIVPSGYVIETMIEDGLLSPIDVSMIPNFANVGDAFKNPAYDPDNQYTIPYQWGTVGIMYNASTVDAAPTSWNDLFIHDGPVAWLEDVRAMFGIALLMLGKDPNSADPDDVAAARDFLIANGDNVVTIVVGNSQQLIESGEVDMAVDYNGNTFQVQRRCDCLDYLYVIPDEGSNLWIDNVAIAADAPNAALAHVFMDYLLIPQVGADISNYLSYASPNQAALDGGLIDPLQLDSPVIYPDPAQIDTLFLTLSIPYDAELLYADAWDQVKINIGQ